MNFQLFWCRATIGFNSFQWSETTGQTMERWYGLEWNGEEEDEKEGICLITSLQMASGLFQTLRNRITPPPNNI